jgi:hypothetical protein
MLSLFSGRFRARLDPPRAHPHVLRGGGGYGIGGADGSY